MQTRSPCPVRSTIKDTAAAKPRTRASKLGKLRAAAHLVMASHSARVSAAQRNDEPRWVGSSLADAMVRSTTADSVAGLDCDEAEEVLRSYTASTSTSQDDLVASSELSPEPQPGGKLDQAPVAEKAGPVMPPKQQPAQGVTSCETTHTLASAVLSVCRQAGLWYILMAVATLLVSFGEPLALWWNSHWAPDSYSLGAMGCFAAAAGIAVAVLLMSFIRDVCNSKAKEMFGQVKLSPPPPPPPPPLPLLS